jgi:ABC-type amino acid transport system permease subunit
MRDLRAQVKSQFPVIYLTLISVIQASVLGYLFVQADLVLPALRPRSAVLLVDTFLTLGVVWNEYVMGTSTFRWIPRLRDAFLPMLLGACQYFMARSIVLSSPSWFFGLCALCVVGFVAFTNQYRVARLEPENDKVFAALGSGPRVSQFIVLGGAVLAALAGALDLVVEGGRGEGYATACLASLVPVGYIARSVWYWGRLFPPTPADAGRP